MKFGRTQVDQAEGIDTCTFLAGYGLENGRRAECFQGMM